MKIYADVLFFINFVSTYIVTDLTARLARSKPRLPRRLAASAVGGLAAVLGFCAGDYTGVIRLAACVFVPLTAFGPRGAPRNIALFSLISVSAAGLFALISGAGKRETVVIRGGIMYFDIPALKFLAIFAASYFAITIALGVTRRGSGAKTHILDITFKGVTARVTALSDSGNTLREPITGKSVIIAEWDGVKRLFGNIEYSELKKNAESHKLWIVPYRAVGSRGLIYAFLADDIKIVDEKRRAGRLFVGITNGRLSAKNEYNALMDALI